MKNILLLIPIVICCIQCKRVDDSLEGRNIYAGRVGIKDTINGDSTLQLPAAGLDIYIYENNNAYYLYKKVTDAKGFFTMDFLKEQTQYRIVSSLVINNISYTGDTSFETKEYDKRNYYVHMVNDSIKLNLYSNASQIAMYKVYVKDTAGALLPNVDVLLFTSRMLLATKNAVNANYKSTTDASGKAVFNNPASGYYYVFAQKTIDSVYSAIDSVTIVKGNVTAVDTLRLRR